MTKASNPRTTSQPAIAKTVKLTSSPLAARAG